MKAIVCVKQVPDTQGKVAVKADGTMDRAAMATITNPDDLNAVEAALQLKDETGCEVVVVTMGPPPAEGMLRELIARGADRGVLVSAREFGGSDTFATSQILAAAVNKIGVGPEDIVFCGRQAIDGDTAQVGPQIAEKLGLPQVTYAEEVGEVKDGRVTIRRRIENGIETVTAPLPLLITVNGSAEECRPRNAKAIQKYKYAAAPSELCDDDKRKPLVDAKPYLQIGEWSADFVGADREQCGLPGSPTKVKKIENVVFSAKEAVHLTDSDAEVEDLVKQLIANHTIG